MGTVIITVIIIDFFNVSNAERVLEGSKSIILRHMIDEFYFFIFTFTLSTVIISNMQLHKFDINHFMAFFTFALFPFSLISRISDEQINVGKIKNKKFQEFISYVKKHNRAIKVLNFFLNLGWLQIAFIGIAYEFAQEMNYKGISSFGVYEKLIEEDSRMIWIILLFIIMLYSAYRFSTHPSIKNFFSYSKSKYLLTITLDDGKLSGEYYLRVNEKYYLLSEEHSFYTDSETIAIKKSDVKKIIFKRVPIKRGENKSF